MGLTYTESQAAWECTRSAVGILLTQMGVDYALIDLRDGTTSVIFSAPNRASWSFEMPTPARYDELVVTTAALVQLIQPFFTPAEQDQLITVWEEHLQ